jgi:predicted metal-dependent phosphoesterase TrpH
MQLPEIVTPFQQEGHWFRANLHCHTTNSDSSWSPQECADLYREAGYDILAITDHDHFTPVDDMQRDDFLLIPSAEYHPMNSASTMSKRHHIVCLDLKRDHAPTEKMHPQVLIKAVLADGGMVISGHPYWLKQNISDMEQLDGIFATEVFNTVCARVGREFSDQIWDDYCLRIKPIGAVASDDSHGVHAEFAKGWTWIRAKDLTLPSVMDALKNGMYYASTGPQFKDIRVERAVEEGNGWKHYKVTVECTPAQSIRVVVGFGGEQVIAEEDQTVTSAEFVVGPQNPFARVEVHAADGTKAWAHPILLHGEW